MAIEEKNIQIKAVPHRLVLENRENLSVSGVRDVENFTEAVVNLDTTMGRLIIKGEGLKINKLNVDTGDLNLAGKINTMEFSKAAPKGNILERLFK